MQSVLIYINTIIFLFLSALHFYWAFGGKWVAEKVIPTSPAGKHMLNPGKSSTLVVALGLLLFAFIIYFRNHSLFFSIPSRYLNVGALFIAGIFLLRAMGDFKYVGFFKKVNNTAFAKNDSKIYSPLCLYLSLSCLIIVILRPA
ncbi:DUF3995 domain-containing protein [Pedobacter nototheniae]|uniref:DUF3995 domain-containing protein n=1 Tax=Pedobacter nototheniae TaxID=2488994 RepID=UPI00292D3C3E|nr:DUF3995 domain-containing protein [Pedobacter nototheniae]